MRRGGVVVYVVVGVLLTIGALVALLHASSRLWTNRMRTDADDIVAKHLARGAVEAMVFGVERALQEELEGVPNFEAGRLHELLLADRTTLYKIWARSTRGDDHSTFLRRLLGPKPFALIDDLRRPHPLAKLTCAAAIAVSNPSDGALADTAPKSAELSLRVECTLRGARHSRTALVSIEIGSRLPGVLGRFTFSAPGMGGNNTMVVDGSGAPVRAAVPLVLIHDAAEYVPTDPIFGGRGGGGRGMPAQRFTTVEELAQNLAARGAVYLGSAQEAGRPAVLKISAGAPPYGQDWQVFGATRDFRLEPQRLPEQPGGLTSLRASQAGTSARQDAWIEGVVSGFHQGIERNRSLFPPDPDGMPDASSWLRPVGTANSPSVGAIYGDVRASLAAVSHMCVDRDGTGQDEAAQRDAGFSLPRREAEDPPFAHATAAEFSADVAREAANGPMARLSFLGSLELGPGQVINHNFISGGAVVPSERRWRVLQLDPRFYSYARMFGGYATYETAMSRRLEMPYNALLRLAGRGPDLVEAELIRRAFRKAEPFDATDRLLRAHWRHTDPMHRAADAASPDFVDSARAAKPDVALEELIVRAIGSPRHVDAHVACHGEPLFRDSFTRGQELDLGGLGVELLPAKDAQRPPVLELGDAIVTARGGGILTAHTIVLSSLRAATKGGSFEPLVVRAQNLELHGGGPFEGTFIVLGQLTVRKKPLVTHALVRGNLVLAPGAQLLLEAPLAVVFDRAHDPTGPDAHLHYRGTVRSAWDERRLSTSDDLIGLNPFRRGELGQ